MGKAVVGRHLCGALAETTPALKWHPWQSRDSAELDVLDDIVT